MNVSFNTIFFILLLGYHSRAQSAYGSTSIVSSSSSAGVIKITNGNIDCGGLKCPENSFSCELDQKTSPDGTTLITDKFCKDKAGNVLAKNETSTPSKNGQKYTAYSYADINGNSKSIVNGRNLSPQEAQALTDEISRTISQTINSVNQEIHEMLDGMFGP